MRLSLGNFLLNTTFPKYQEARLMSVQRSGTVHFDRTLISADVLKLIDRVQWKKKLTQAEVDLHVLRFILSYMIKMKNRLDSHNPLGFADRLSPTTISLKYNENSLQPRSDYGAVLIFINSLFNEIKSHNFRQYLREKKFSELTIHLDVHTTEELKSISAEIFHRLEALGCSMQRSKCEV
jgi:hypothetical protein